MKKLLLALLTVVCTVSAWAQDPDWSVTSFSGSISSNSTTINEATWTLSDMTVGAGTPGWSISGGKWKFGSSKSIFWSSYTLSTDKFNSYNITKVEIGCYDNGGTESSVTAKQGSVTIGTATVSTTTTTNVETLNENQGEGGALQIIFTSTKQASYITSIKVWYTMGADAVHVESVSLDKHNLVVMATKKATLTATVAPVNATNQNVSWSSSDTDVATVEGGVVKGVSAGTATITVTTTDGNKTDQCEVTVTPKTAPVGATFYESFDKLEGAGGNDGTWSGISGTYAWVAEDCDNEDWTTDGTINKGYQCASIRKNTAGSGLTTPEIGVAGNGSVTFNAEAWGGDTSDFYVQIIGGGTFDSDQAAIVSLTNNGTQAKVALQKKGEFKEYNLTFTGLTSSSKFKFYMAAEKRGFLDEVAVFVTPTTETINITTDEGYSTFVCKDAIEMPEGFMGAVAELEGNNLSWNWKYNEGDVVPANTPILVFGLEESAEATITTGGDAPATNYLVANTTGAAAQASELAPSAAKFYVLSYDTDNANLGFYWLTAGGASFEVPAGKVFLALPAEVQARGFALEGEVTGIDAIQNVKGNSVTYNLAGQRVAKNAKGIVIMNGKKMFNK